MQLVRVFEQVWQLRTLGCLSHFGRTYSKKQVEEMRMAKIKISELAGELGCEAKELIAFLQEKGIEAKRSNSSIEETDADVARKNFGKA